jgi:hypothetical protein
MTLRAFAALVLLFSALPVQSAAAQPAQVIVIRHAEQPSDANNPHLSPIGVQRAQRLVSFVRSDPTMSRFGAPVAIFASRPTKHGNGQRASETVTPLATALGIPVQIPFRTNDYDAAAKAILSNPAYNGKTVLVSWTHEDIPDLVKALGVKPKPHKWKGSVYDQVYVISYQNGRPTLTTSRY